MNAPNPSLADELAAALQWWRMAGVDLDFSDDVTNWLAGPDAADALPGASTSAARAPQTKFDPGATQPPKSPQASPPPAAAARVNLLGPNPPQDLASFREWWLTAPGLDAIGPRGRVPPRGPAEPELMVLVIDPEEGDRERLLSGPQGRFLARIIAAMGISEEAVYFASALPRHTPMADTVALAAGGMDAVSSFHVNLVAPQRLLAFGANIPPLIGHALTNDVSHLREINQNSRTVPLMVSEGLDSLMAMPRLKTRFWRRWIEWSLEQ